MYQVYVMKMIVIYLIYMNVYLIIFFFQNAKAMVTAVVIVSAKIFLVVSVFVLCYGGHSRISDNDLLKQILYHFCASHIPTNKLQHVCYSELLSNNCHDATSVVARQQKIAG